MASAAQAGLCPAGGLLYVSAATPSITGPKRGPVPRRRFQKGCFVREPDGRCYSTYYIDADGKSKRKREFLGKIGRKPGELSERTARKKHAELIEKVNQKRGALQPVYRGQTFSDAVNKWRQAIAPNLSPATVRQRESYLRAHILPRFGTMAPHEIGVHEFQTFATDLRRSLSWKTVVNIVSSVFTILEYAAKCKMKIADVSFKDLELGSNPPTTVASFTRGQVAQIVAAAPEPFKTLFAIAWSTGLRAGEILALTVDDLDFNRNDATREVRKPKTPMFRRFASNAIEP